MGKEEEYNNDDHVNKDDHNDRDDGRHHHQHNNDWEDVGKTHTFWSCFVQNVCSYFLFNHDEENSVKYEAHYLAIRGNVK